MSTQIVDVTLLQKDDYFYPVKQATCEVILDEGRRVIQYPRIDRNTGSIVVYTLQGRVDYQNGAKVAREVRS